MLRVAQSDRSVSKAKLKHERTGLYMSFIEDLQWVSSSKMVKVKI